MAADRTAPARDSEQAVTAALQRYRVMANVVGVLLILLIVIAVPLKYLADLPTPVTILGTAHGWLYALFFLCAVDLAVRAKWSLKGSVIALVAGTAPVPLLRRRAHGHPQDACRRTRVTPAPLPHPEPPSDPEDLRLMCGLLAYFSTDADRVDDATIAGVRAAQHCMRHRGPDENEAWWDSKVVFGFNRLSFIDIEHSHQPMPYANGRYRIVFNGEIYNYVELREELLAAGMSPGDRGRHRDDRRGLPPVGRGRRPRGCAACSPSSSGTARPAPRSAPVTPSASSRCSPRGWPTAASSSPPRRRRCSSCSVAARPRAASTRRPCSTT